MNRHPRAERGFTLVELLVVMAIISILAAIVVPNVQRYIVRARVARAVSEINGAELAMTAMLTDAGKSNFNQLFNPDAVRGYLQQQTRLYLLDENQRGTPEFFNAAVRLYTTAAYDLLNYGRNVLRGDGDLDYQATWTPDVNNTPAKPLIDRDVLAKLGDQYMALGNDPWGNDYHFFPGPWRVHTNPSGTQQYPRAPIIFRKFTVEQSSGGSQRGARNDGYVLNNATLLDAFGDIIESPETWPTNAGYPAETGKAVFIWSYGANLRNGQMIYQRAYDLNNPRSWYEAQEEGDIGGGDDINNWDPGASWQRFYN